MKQLMILLYTLGGLFITSHLKAQVVLEALEAPNEKCLERVYDKYYGDGVHNYIYCAVQGPNGKKWLNLNLGAEYAKESSPHFNPEAQPTDYNDWKAFGNLYQWGRDSDGHEQVEYRQGSEFWEFRPINGVRTTLVGPGETSNQMVSVPGSSTYASYNLGDTWLNDPCPESYRVMKRSDVTALGRLFPIIGLEVTTSIFGNAGEYPYLKLMTSPSGGRGPYSTLWQATWASLYDNIGGTSSLWIGSRGSEILEYYDGIWHRRSFDGTWGSVFIDRGIRLAGGIFGSYGILTGQGTADPPEARAIRCVQK